MYSEQAWPRSAKSLVIVFLAAPVIRTVARIELPSTRHPMIRARSSVLSLFIVTIMLDRSGISQGGRRITNCPVFPTDYPHRFPHLLAFSLSRSKPHRPMERIHKWVDTVPNSGLEFGTEPEQGIPVREKGRR